MKEYLYPPTASDYLPSSSLHLGKHTQSKHLAELTERVYYTVNAMKVWLKSQFGTRMPELCRKC
jgi:hypothetical protein